MESIEDDAIDSFKWSADSTKALLRNIKICWKELKFHKAKKFTKKKVIWDKISLELKIQGFSPSGIECHRKFRNLKVLFFFF